MLKFILFLLIGLSNLSKSIAQCVDQYGQYGGVLYRGLTTCCYPYTCVYMGVFYSQCLLTATQSPSWLGPKCCDFSTCTYSNAFYSQCLPTSGVPSSSGSTSSTSTRGPTHSSSSSSSTRPSSTTHSSSSSSATSSSTTTQSSPSSSSSNSGSSSASTTTISSETNNGETGFTTRCWDCCKASCSWPDKACVTNLVETCAQDGVTPVDPNIQSICDRGTAYMCTNQQPWNVSSTVSYGFAAAYITSEDESDWCCACYSLMFTSGPVAGLQMIVQVTNTGSDLGNNQFNLEIPGGGYGLHNGCTSQFPGSYSWGQQYGGVSQRSDFANLPSVLQPGCYWRFDWFQDANNVSTTFTEVSCPSVLTDKTQCSID